MAKKISFKAMNNKNQIMLGQEDKEKKELCRFKDNCDRIKCPCHLFRMRI